jgi:hypothetical protein
MSFSHLEKALILLRDRGQWSRAVAVAVQARYDRHDRPDPHQAPEPPRDLRNFVFIADFAPGYTNTTAFVSYFKLTELEYCLLHDLGAMRPPIEAEQTRLKTEYLGRVYPLSTATQDFARARVAVFGAGDFSRTTVLDMRSLVHSNGRAYFVFYRHYYLPALQLCGRQEAPELHADMLRLGERLMAEAQANAEAQAAQASTSAERPREPSPPAATTHTHTQHSTHDTHHAHSGHDRFPCPPTPALLGVRKNLGPYTIPPSPLMMMMSFICSCRNKK